MNANDNDYKAYVKKTSDQLSELTSQLILTEEKERRRIAVVLHDKVNQNLVFSKMRMNDLAQNVSKEINDEMAFIYQLIEQCILDISTLVVELSPPILYDLGLQPALEWLVENMQDKTKNTLIIITGHNVPNTLEEKINILIFHSVRELLFNMIKYSQAKKAEVNIINTDGFIEITVKDNGIGFNVIEKSILPSFGLFSINQRMEGLGGSFEINSTLNKGTSARMRIPN